MPESLTEFVRSGTKEAFNSALEQHLRQHLPPCYCAFHKRGDYWSFAWEMMERTEQPTKYFWAVVALFEMETIFDEAG